MKIEIIPTKGWLYDKCENMEQLYDKYYYPLLVENQELKKQLKGTTHCYDEAEHRQLKQENEELKKQLKEEKRSHEYDERIVEQHCDFVDEHYRQQKEFIKYLEEKEKQFDRIGDPINSGACCGILQKYKEIIGETDEKDNN